MFTNGDYRKQVDLVMVIKRPDSYYIGETEKNTTDAREIAKLKKKLRKEKQKAIRSAVEAAEKAQSNNEDQK